MIDLMAALRDSVDRARAERIARDAASRAITRCGFVADYESKPWQCERRAGHDGDHRSEPLT